MHLWTLPLGNSCTVAMSAGERGGQREEGACGDRAQGNISRTRWAAQCRVPPGSRLCQAIAEEQGTQVLVVVTMPLKSQYTGFPYSGQGPPATSTHASWDWPCMCLGST